MRGAAEGIDFFISQPPPPPPLCRHLPGRERLGRGSPGGPSGPRPEPWVRKGRSGGPMDRHCPQLRRPTAVGCRCSAQTSDARRAGPDARRAAGRPAAPARVSGLRPQSSPADPTGAAVWSLGLTCPPSSWSQTRPSGCRTRPAASAPPAKRPSPSSAGSTTAAAAGRWVGPARRSTGSGVRGQGSVAMPGRLAREGSGALVQSPEPQPCWEPRHLVGAWPRAGAGMGLDWAGPAAAPAVGPGALPELGLLGPQPVPGFPEGSGLT